MPKWTPKPIWLGRDVLVIGGGQSLQSFDWDRLHEYRTIGCNSAYLHGPSLCKVCVFADGDPRDRNSFWSKYWTELAVYAAQGGMVFTNHPALYHADAPWLWTTQRQARGLSTTGLCWNRNTGSTAVNLALLFGAKRIFLLGFDMLPNGNWHRRSQPSSRTRALYVEFIHNFKYVVDDWHRLFVDCEIYNVTDNSSLPETWFPRIAVKDLWAKL